MNEICLVDDEIAVPLEICGSFAVCNGNHHMKDIISQNSQALH
jgi:hypothetical protein